MPLIVFGDALFKKDNNRLKGHLPGVSSRIARQMKIREKRGELLFMTIWEYNTSKVCIRYEPTYHFSTNLIMSRRVLYVAISNLDIL